jgi:hypothetical protein
MQIFARITKVDEQTGKVYGRAVQEVLDRSGEIFDYETSKPNFAKWSEDAAKATDGKSVGNVRAMHGKIAAGKLTEITFNDAEKAIDVCAEVVDPVEREKCLKGVYSGFSIGGRYAKKWADEVHKGVERYTAEPTEISLVDLPCVPTAQFTVVKADGAEELRKFEATTDNLEAMRKWADSLDDEAQAVLRKLFAEEPAAKSDDLAKRFEAIAGIVQGVEKIAKRPDVNPKEGEKKYGNVEYADPKNKKYPLDTPKHIKAAWSYIHMPKNAAKYSSEDASAIKAKIAAAWKKAFGKDPDEAEKVLAAQAERLAKNADAVPLAAQISVILGHQPQLEKGLWAVSQFAQLLEQIACMADGVDWEEESEGDDSSLPAEMRAALKPLASAFLAMAEEETNEALHGQLNDDAALALAAGDKDDLQKVGRKHTKATRAHLAAIREHLDQLQADDPANDDDKDDAEKLAKAADDLQKVTKERDAAAAALEKLTAEHEALLKKAAPPKGAARPVEKTLGMDQIKTEPDEPVRKADGTVDHAAEAQRLMKAAYAKPQIAAF